MYYFFFFQAEDGIRDYKVTGVQTCALPIYRRKCQCHLCAAAVCGRCRDGSRRRGTVTGGLHHRRHTCSRRSEERRVGKECRSRWSPDHLKKKKQNTAVGGWVKCKDNR